MFIWLLMLQQFMFFASYVSFSIVPSFSIRNTRIMSTPFDDLQPNRKYSVFTNSYHRTNITTPTDYPRDTNKNITIQPMSDEDFDDEFEKLIEEHMRGIQNSNSNKQVSKPSSVLGPDEQDSNPDVSSFEGPFGIRVVMRKQEDSSSGKTNSENFCVEKNTNVSFADIGGYVKVKEELMQSIDILVNYEKYEQFNVRTPKGLILEGPPGNGKTLLAKGLSNEANISFIPVSGSEFQEKYVGVGASRIRELFELANENKPTIVFIDEIDALGRKRQGTDEGGSNGERDSTLNELLVALDGYKANQGVFVMGATNRVDLLDSALIRPGRIDKKIYVDNPDAKTREEILKIHIKGKPYDSRVHINSLVDTTNGLSGAEIENLLNEAMLLALREDRYVMTMSDIETILSRIQVGYQSSANTFSDDMIHRIAIHEMGHALVGIFSLNHAKLLKVCLNVWSPTTPGYTVFEHSDTDTNIYTKEKLFSRLMVLLGGRIAEEVFFGASITSGASKDIEEAYNLAESMIIKLGMGTKIVYPYRSENSKSSIDRDIEKLIERAYYNSHQIIERCKPVFQEASTVLIEKKILSPEEIDKLILKHDITM